MQSTQGPDATENGLSTSRRRIARDGAPTPTPVPTAASPPDQPTLINARPSGENKRPLDTDDADDSSDRPGEQRRATNIACDYCRTNHLKCNGAKTCSQCKKRELSCVYPQPKKRGPKPGVSSKLKQQQQIIASLQEEIEKQRNLAHEWRMKYLMSFHAPPNRDDSVAQLGSEDPEMYRPHVVQRYLDHFLKMEEERKKQQKTVYLQIHTVLAHGARKAGHSVHAEMFIRRARHILRELFDTTDYEVANGLCMLGVYYYGTSDDRPRASYYIALTIKMCECLHALETTLVGRVAMLVQAMSSEKYEERLAILNKLRASNPSTPELLQALIVLVYTEVRFAPPNTVHVPYPDLLRLLEEADALLTKLALDQNDPVWLTFMIMIGGCRAAVFWNSNMREFALDWAAKAARHLKHDAIVLCSSHTLMGLDMMAQVHWEAKQLDNLADDVQAMKALSRIYSAADLTIRRFNALFNASNNPIAPPTPAPVPPKGTASSEAVLVQPQTPSAAPVPTPAQGTFSQPSTPFMMQSPAPPPPLTGTPGPGPRREGEREGDVSMQDSAEHLLELQLGTTMNAATPQPGTPLLS